MPVHYGIAVVGAARLDKVADCLAGILYAVGVVVDLTDAGVDGLVLILIGYAGAAMHD